MKANAAIQTKPWLYWFAVLTALATLALIGIGGLVTSHEAGMSVPDWPTTYGYNMFLFPISKWLGGIFYEHSHRLLASLVGLMTTILAVWLWLKDSRQWMHWLGVAAFLLVVAQGVLGGLRVTLHMDSLGIYHATIAQLFFVLTCALALFTSRWWQNIGRDALPRVPNFQNEAAQQRGPTMQNLRWLVLATTLLIFVQLIIAAAMRHQHAGLAISDFPLAHGKLWPDTGADAIARYNAQRVSINAENPITAFQIELQMAHRVVALAILICVGAVVFCSRRCQSAERAIAPPAHVGGYEELIPRQIFWQLGEEFVFPAAFAVQNFFPEFLGRGFKDKFERRRKGQPRLAFHFAFKLAGRPAGVTGEHPHFFRG